MVMCVLSTIINYWGCCRFDDWVLKFGLKLESELHPHGRINHNLGKPQLVSSTFVSVQQMIGDHELKISVSTNILDNCVSSPQVLEHGYVNKVWL